MKKLNVALIVTFLIVTFASVAIASAQTPGTTTITGTAQVFWSGDLVPGKVATATVNFQSSSSSELLIYQVGIHADWQDNNQYYMLTLSSPQTLQANGLYVTSVSINIPPNVNVGTHTIYLSVGGSDSSGNEFKWDSPTQNINVVATSSSTGPNNSGNPGTSNGGLNNLIIYGAVIAVVAVVVVLLVVIMLKRRGKPTAAPAYTPQPVNGPPPQSESPEDSGSEEKPEGKDFNI